MLGPLVNALAVCVCALVGTFAARKIPTRFQEIVQKAVGLVVLYIGLKGAFDSHHTLLLIMSLVLGGVVGEALNIDKAMNSFGAWLGKRLTGPKGSPADKGQTVAAGSDANGKFSQGFVQATLIFCVGSMAIVGSLQSGMQGDNNMLFAKSVIDGTTAIVLSAMFGAGVIFSAIPVFVYEGAIALLAMFAGNYLSAETITEMSAAGSLTIAAIGFNFLGVSPIKVANLIPAIFVPLVYFAVRNLFV
jgi:uncharacterized membrane protein YqgA involved in biofilm formation